MNYRQVSILRDLLLTDDFMAGKTLANKYSVSTKTIYSDLSFLNREIEELSNKIEKIPRRGIRLAVNANEKKHLAELLNHFHTEEMNDISREYLLLKSLFFDEKEIDIVDWSVQYFVSETSVRRDIDKLENKFAVYKIHMERHNGKYRIVGQEQEIRKFLRNYLITEFHLSRHTITHTSQFTYFFSKEEIERVISIVNHYAATYHFILSEQYSIYLIVDLLIAKMRYLNGNAIVSSEMLHFVNDLSYYEVYTFAGDLFREFVCLKDKSMPLLEIINLSYTLLSVGYETNDLIVGDQINNIINNLIDRVSQLLSIDLRGDHHLFKMLVSHVQPMIFRLKNKIMVNSDITEEIKKKYSVLYNIVWLSCRELSDAFSIDITDGEMAFLTVHFEIAIEKLAKPLMIYVVCPQGLATTELIMTSLSHVISNFDHLIKIDASELTQAKIKQADMIISSISLSDIEVDESKVVFISPVLTDADLENLQNQYLQLQKGNRRVLSVIENKEVYTKSLIHQLIGKNVFLKVDKRTVNDCIDFLVEKSTDQNRKNQLYHQSILIREDLGSTSVYTGIALPHALPVAVSESQLVMMTLKKPIRWGSNMVKVIMLISMSQEDEFFYKDALISIYSKIDSSEYIDKLWHSSTVSDFIELL
ncbi:BglG family transcription antiterminator [Streptococcus orisasini]|uniref:BglG family transcription antiterminator n=1 Tax=Streptococcus orisasini TaxID=1080071 RepID=UPI000710D84E|nr:PTS sugar transporter subunit IIA [Streptococcus orisasini]